MADLRQYAVNAIRTGQGRTCTVTPQSPTTPGSLVVVVALATTPPFSGVLFGPSGFTLAGVRNEDELTMAVWYRPACPSLSSVGVAALTQDPMQVWILEYSGMTQGGNVLDRVSIGGDNDERDGYTNPNVSSGYTAQTSQGEELVLGLIGNRYASATQGGFGGGMAMVSQSVTPTDSDRQRNRLTVHQAFPTQQGQFRITGRLSAPRDWVAMVLTFRAGVVGPLRMTSLGNGPMVEVGGSGNLTVFGLLRSTLTEPMVTVGGSGRMGPFAGQMRLRGWSGLLIGEGTPYRIESTEGLGGQDVRSSDSDFPRGAGAQRGVDLQAARQIMLRLNFHDVDPVEHERLLTELYATLVPQRDQDWSIVFRRHGQPLQKVWARPGQLVREQSALDMLLHSQAIMLRAADPRIYSATEREIRVPVTPATATAPAAVTGLNIGNAAAYPVIRMQNRGLVDVTTVELTNATADVAFRVDATILPGAELVGDMPARVTAAPRSVVTIGGQPVYNAWALPRDDFFIAPAPEAPAGANALHLRTVPAGADVACTVTYPDTWAN